MSLYKKYRPTSLKTFYGNEDLKRDLRPFLKGARPLPPAILFTGPSGCGKTTLARILAKGAGCSDHDLQELNTADFRGIDSARDICRQMSYAPLSGAMRVWILDEAHKLTNDAQNALLKALEDPPAHVHFILCTTDPQQLLKTVLTRCTKFAVESLSDDDLIEIMLGVCEKEEVPIEDKHLEHIARQANGSARAALSALELVLGRDPEDFDKTVASIESFESQVVDLCRLLIAGKAKWKDVVEVRKALKEEPESVRRAVLGYMNAVLLSGKDSARAVHVIECFKEPYYNTGPAGLTLSCYYGLMLDS